MIIAEIDAIMRLSFASLIDDISAGSWSGRERELVSLFCFGHLLRHCRPSGILSDPTQVGIEVAVPQLSNQAELSGRSASKKLVCKDIVVWPRPRMTCWDLAGAPTLRPASIVEWKHKTADVSDYDAKWLAAFSAGTEDFVGYAVCTNRGGAGGFRLSCTRVHMGQVQRRWLVIA